MKFLLSSLLIIFFSVTAFSQVTVGSSEYDYLKSHGELLIDEFVYDPSLFDPTGLKPHIGSSGGGTKSACDCYQEPDATYILAMGPNDDGSSALINIPFDFCFYGQTYNSFYINNNGNITFTGPLAAFSSTAFPSAGNQILAPFWADVDTRGGFGQVVYKITPTAVYINWEDVGYYSIQGDKLNTFQLIITDGADPVVSSGNVAFCYQDMQWTTGAASGGVGGFGGIPATCGANKGDGLAYFLISQFDHAGVDFDGALGLPDGISWLDYKSFYFDACNTSNVPPIPEGISQCDTFRVCTFGDTADISINFLSPEVSQITSITWSNGGLASLAEIVNIPGNTAQLVLRIIGNIAEAGSYTVTATGTDNFAPTPGITTISFTIIIENSPVIIDPILTPTEGCDSILVSVLNGPYDTYLWDDLDNTPTNYITQSGVQGVTISLNGCYKRVDTLFTISTAPFFNLQGTLNVCPTELANVYIPDSLNLDSITWYLPNPTIDSLFSNSFGTGTYNITIWDSSGYCSADTTFNVNVAPPSIIFGDQTICTGAMDYQVVGLGANPSGVWSSTSPEITFSDPNTTDPLITTATPGEYTVEYSSGCDTVSAVIIFAQLPVIFPDTLLCGTWDYQALGTIAYQTGGYWSEPSGNLTFAPDNAEINPMISSTVGGIYTVTFTDSVCGNTDVATIEMAGPTSIFGDTIACNLSMFAVGTIAYQDQGTWFSASPEITFSPNTTTLNPTISATTPGTYTVTYTSTVCNETVTADITFPDIPVIFNDTSVCNLSYVVTGTVVHATGGVWTASDPSISFSPSSTATNPTITATTSGVYTVTFTDNACGNTDQAQIEFVAPPSIDLTSPACFYNLFVSGTQSYYPGQWTASDTSVNFNATNVLNPEVWVSNPGTYTLTFTDDVCNQSVSQVVEFPPYAWTEVRDTVICFGSEYQIYANENWSIDNYTWNTGETGPSIFVTQAGDYIVTGSNVCHTVTDTATIGIKFCDIDAPNIISLSSQVGNNFWYVNYEGVSQFECSILNRWGNLIYEFTDPASGWDGRTMNGTVVDEGTYFYIIRATFEGGHEITKHGSIQVVH
jgi:hypothetical protein